MRECICYDGGKSKDEQTGKEREGVKEKKRTNEHGDKDKER